MLKLMTPIALIAAAAIAATAYAVSSSSSTGRADCPGKIVCPLTGELVCRDRCPTADRNRGDCPGRIECPITGELVCRDLCPAGGTVVQNTKTGSRPSCCEATT